MSQRPSASRPASRPPSDGQRTVLPSIQARDDLQQPGRPVERQRPESAGRGFQSQESLQIVRPAPSSRQTEDWRASGPSRDLGVHSILNPSEPESGRSSSHHHGGSNADGALPAGGPPPHSYPSLQPTTGTPPSAEEYRAPYAQPRRILTPRSPSRTLSSSRGLGRTTIDAQRSPFLPSRGRPFTVDTGSPLDSPPDPATTQPQQQYGFTQTTSAPSADPRPSIPSVNDPRHAPQSQSASPSISASSLNPSSAQTSPASFLYHKSGQGPPPSSSYFPGQSFAGPSMLQTPGGGGMQGMQYQGTPEGPYSTPASQTPGGDSPLNSTAGSSRQTSASDPIQVLTITTSSGQYQVPVDVHQASKLADEKRARNAGASARFRQRRKEKEREASTSIEKLQSTTRDLERRLRDVEQERDFYRSERDRLRDVVFRTPDMRHLAMQAPPSPRSMRGPGPFAGSGQQLGPGQLGGHPPPPGFISQPPGSMNERAPRRRRIDTRGGFTDTPYALPHASNLPPVGQHGYQVSGPAQGPTSLPPLRMEPTTPGSTQPPSATLAPQPAFDPYSRGPPPSGSFDQSWPPPGPSGPPSGDSVRR